MGLPWRPNQYDGMGYLVFLAHKSHTYQEWHGWNCATTCSMRRSWKWPGFGFGGLVRTDSRAPSLGHLLRIYRCMTLPYIRSLHNGTIWNIFRVFALFCLFGKWVVSGDLKKHHRGSTFPIGFESILWIWHLSFATTALNIFFVLHSLILCILYYYWLVHVMWPERSFGSMNI